MQLVLEVCDVKGVNSAVSARKLFDGAGGVIGRGAGCDWTLADSSRLLSSHHGLVAFREGRYFLTDISTNGIGVSGSAERLRKGQARLIGDGEVFELGPFALRARLITQAPSRDEPYDVVGGAIPDDAFLSLDPIQSLDIEHLRQTTSLELAALEEATEVHGSWSDHSVASSDHLTLPRRAETVRETPPTPGVATPPDSSEFWAQFAAALGIRLETLDRASQEALAIKVARLLRIGVEGLQHSLRTREELKSELDLPFVDTLHKSRNPLNAYVDTDAVLARLLGPGETDDLPAEQAITHVHRELQAHQVALLAACRSALRNARTAFAPGHLLMGLDYRDKRPWFSTDGGHWRAYQRHYQRLIADEQWYGGDFAKAYEEQVRLISTLHVDYSG
ncbi:type VI secretion system-associated FHA domain protein TagH [Pseudomonas antarctica]|uniref:type VI secretion system-associated FHA domain protein TagH n=1 Tax=Pseudomonas antarctica TaxID=219572 RepID=UPI00387AC0F6